MNIKNIIQELSKSEEEIYSQLCTVTAVDKDNFTCTCAPLNGDPELFEVKFTPDSDSDIVVIPASNSLVIVSFLNKDNAYISMFSKVDKYQFKTAQEDLKTIISDLLDTIGRLTVTTPTGPSGTPINATEFTGIKTRLDNLFI